MKWKQIIHGNLNDLQQTNLVSLQHTHSTIHPSRNRTHFPSHLLSINVCNVISWVALNMWKWKYDAKFS